RLAADELAQRPLRDLPTAAELEGAQLAVADVLADGAGVDVEDLGDLGGGQEVAADQLLLQRGDPAAPLALRRVEVLQQRLEGVVHGRLRKFEDDGEV